MEITMSKEKIEQLIKEALVDIETANDVVEEGIEDLTKNSDARRVKNLQDELKDVIINTKKMLKLIKSVGPEAFAKEYKLKQLNNQTIQYNTAMEKMVH